MMIDGNVGRSMLWSYGIGISTTWPLCQEGFQVTVALPRHLVTGDEAVSLVAIFSPGAETGEGHRGKGARLSLRARGGNTLGCCWLRSRQ
jgi:hypothetical protein